MKTGIFSGSFNPIHIGHLALANWLCEHTDMEEVWFLLTPHNPLKERESLMDDDFRLQMVKEAIGDYPHFKAMDTEFHLPRPSYTVQTLETLCKQYPEREFQLIMGADNWASIEQWKSYETILQKYPIRIYPRKGSRINIAHPQGMDVQLVNAPLMEISSTFIRKSINEGKDIRFFLPEKIRHMMSKMLLTLLLLLTFAGSSMQAQSTDKADKEIFNKYVSNIKQKGFLSSEALMIETAKFFLGTPYVSYTLEKEPEQLVVNLRELDCATFSDIVLALSRTMRSEKQTFETLKKQLLYIRYRNGTIQDYCDRIHYTSDWFFENAKKGFIKDMSNSIGGLPLPINVYFMSTHPKSYRQLKNNPILTAKIKKIEDSINARTYYFLPNKLIPSCKQHIHSGDIIGFTTKIKGLDTSHMGIAYWETPERLTFIHASSTAKKVIVQQTTLEEYMKMVSKNTGILIARPLLNNL